MLAYKNPREILEKLRKLMRASHREYREERGNSRIMWTIFIAVLIGVSLYYKEKNKED